MQKKPPLFLIHMFVMAALLFSGCAFDEFEKEEVEAPVEVIREVEVEKIVEIEKEIGAFVYEQIPEYNEAPFVEINDGTPFFGEELMSVIHGEFYSELDRLGRCGVAMALLGEETMPEDSRGQIGDVRPSGWQIKKYEGIDGNYLYNRCHLIGWQLSGENDNVRNLITGTRYMNVQGMEPFEDKVARYIRKTGNHVLYRATPVFLEDELVARGVLLEAQSVEDGGIRFNVFCYNVQPDVDIDYKTGESQSTKQKEDAEKKEKASFSLDDFGGAASETGEVADRSVPPEDEAAIVEASQEDDGSPVNTQAQEQPASEPATATYIGNKNSKKFHYSWCASVKEMAKHNKVMFSDATREDITGKGYEPCRNCNP